MKVKSDNFILADQSIPPGTKKYIEIPVSRLITGSPVSIPVQVFHGAYKGPVLWINAAIHGDEIQGVEIIRRVTELLNPKKLCGTIISVPIVNIHGFIHRDRYLPDRRDLNRSFPGSPKGSLASRIANLFITEIVQKSDYGIDLHTGSDGRNNLPHIRTNLEDTECRDLALIFGAPVIVDSKERDGSLRAAAIDINKKILLFEGGEANRFNESAIQTAVMGISRILAYLGIIEMEVLPPPYHVQISTKTSWIRAKKSGIARLETQVGDVVEKGNSMGIIYDSIGKKLSSIKAHMNGLVIGKTETPLINQGDAMYHIAEVEK